MILNLKANNNNKFVKNIDKKLTVLEHFRRHRGVKDYYPVFNSLSKGGTRNQGARNSYELLLNIIKDE